MIETREQVIERMIAAIAPVLSVSVDDVRGKGREKSAVEARQILYRAAHEIGGMSSTDIARVLDRDHSSVITGLKSLGRKCARDAWLNETTQRLLDELRSGGPLK
ncbi:MAG TPA: helix-turn-helix domain-containing protein [Lacunisphaera sp.]|nr:helix-turn-helix domain-containing protein [Lacunisphaera sp.]